jgi:uncharacterized protein YbjT (DUF2867 family)
MVSILGAGGAIGGELVRELIARTEAVRLVSRNPKLVPGAAEAVAADLSNFDDTVKVGRLTCGCFQVPTSLPTRHTIPSLLGV